MNAVAAKAATSETEQKKKKKKPPRIEINKVYCKGCGICVAFCPTKSLAMEGGKVKVVALEKCISCMFCELRCPDFAIAVFQAED